MEESNFFKYKLPFDCPKIFIDEKNLHEGGYSICYFRVTKNSPPDDQDYTPHFFLKNFSGQRKRFEKEEDFATLCQMASLSILPNKSEAIKLMRKFKKIGKYIYKGIVLKEHGLLISSPSNLLPNHCSFYVYAKIDEQNIFTERCEL